MFPYPSQCKEHQHTFYNRVRIVEYFIFGCLITLALQQIFLAIILRKRSWRLPTYGETSTAPMVANEGFTESPRPPPKTDAVSTVSVGCHGLRNSHLVGSVVDGRRRRCCLQVGQIYFPPTQAGTPKTPP